MLMKYNHCTNVAWYIVLLIFQSQLCNSNETSDGPFLSRSLGDNLEWRLKKK
jgi:hypothetical protein